MQNMIEIRKFFHFSYDNMIQALFTYIKHGQVLFSEEDKFHSVWFPNWVLHLIEKWPKKGKKSSLLFLVIQQNIRRVL